MLLSEDLQVIQVQWVVHLRWVLILMAPQIHKGCRTSSQCSHLISNLFLSLAQCHSLA